MRSDASVAGSSSVERWMTAGISMVQHRSQAIARCMVPWVALFLALTVNGNGVHDVTAVPSPRQVVAPVAADITIRIDSSQRRRPISRFIYGLNAWDASQRPAHLTLSRSGGNRMTAYNWENNASNAGADYLNQNDDFLGGGTVPNGAVGPAIVSARNAGAAILVTLPTIGYVAADKNGGGDVNKSAHYLSERFKRSLPRKGAPFSLTPDTRDAFVYQDEYVYFLDQTYPGAFAHPTRPIFLSLDNEPDLWHLTHARLRGDAVGRKGTNVGYAEIVQLTRDYALAAKAVNPAVQVFGPVNYGWQGMANLQDATDGSGRDFLDFFLEQMALAERTDGHRLLDVLDVHWYPEAQGTNAAGVATRIIGESTDPGVANARQQAPRSLWDPDYIENSWITGCCSGGAIRLIPRLLDKIARHYPGTRLGITEYNYGAPHHISGAIAQADALGIFGREGVFAAANWRLASSNDFLFGAFEIYRNMDGDGGSFGDTSIQATTSNIPGTSVYASVDEANDARMVLVAINKDDRVHTAAIAITHRTELRRARVYTLTAANSHPQRQSDLTLPGPNALTCTMPPESITTLVLLP